MTQPIDMPVKVSHSHQSIENDLLEHENLRVKGKCQSSLILLIMEFCQAEDGKEREEKEHGIEKDKTRDSQPSNIWKST